MIKVLLKFLTTYFVLCQLLKIENLFLDKRRKSILGISLTSV